MPLVDTAIGLGIIGTFLILIIARQKGQSFTEVLKQIIELLKGDKEDE